MSRDKPIREMSESGMLVDPPLPVPKFQRDSEPRLPKKKGPSGFEKFMTVVFIAMLLAAAAGGFMLRPYILEDSNLAEAKKELANEKLAKANVEAKVKKMEDDSKKLDEQRELLNKQLEAASKAADMVSEKQADAAKIKTDLESVKKKLDATGAGTANLEGLELHLVISDAKLFKSGDELSGAGNKTLDKIAAVLKEMPDKDISVNGHTDDQPPPKAPRAPKRNPKDKSPMIVQPPPEPEFATNWELSSARALAVIHYLQDQHKIEAGRLSAHAFSQYRPMSKSRASNRRIELVLTQKPPKK